MPNFACRGLVEETEALPKLCQTTREPARVDYRLPRRKRVDPD
jgi:hypothetical protein